PAHLVEIGLNWPPDTFLRWKLEGLVRRGFRITVVSPFRYGPPFTIDGVEVVDVDDATTPRYRDLPGVLREFLALALTQPRRLVAVLVAFARPSRRSPRRASFGYWPSPWRKLSEEIAWLRV